MLVVAGGVHDGLWSVVVVVMVMVKKGYRVAISCVAWVLGCMCGGYKAMSGWVGYDEKCARI